MKPPEKSVNIKPTLLIIYSLFPFPLCSSFYLPSPFPASVLSYAYFFPSSRKSYELIMTGHGTECKIFYCLLEMVAMVNASYATPLLFFFFF